MMLLSSPSPFQQYVQVPVKTGMPYVQVNDSLAIIIGIIGLVSSCFGIGILFGIISVILGKNAQEKSNGMKGRSAVSLGYLDITIGIGFLFLILMVNIL